jgi:inhibitor of cysteine peptidase
MHPNSRQIACRLYVLAFTLWAVFALELLYLSGCQVCDRDESFREGKTLAGMTLTQSDNGKSVTISPGETVRISLDENPSTGFRWALEQGNDEILELLTSDYIQASGAGVGGGGQRVWKFTAKKSGDVRLVMKRWRAWEGDKSTVERFEVTIRVKS